MTRKPLKIILIGIFATLVGILSFQLPGHTHSPFFGVKLLVLLALAVSFHRLGHATLSRFAMAMTLTAMASPFFVGREMHFGPLSMFNWVGVFLIVLLALNWSGSDAKLPRPMVNSTLLLILFAGIPILIFFQLNPLLEEVYAQPILANLMNFLPIPLGFSAFLLGLNLKQSAAVHIAFGIPLLLPLLLGLFR